LYVKQNKAYQMLLATLIIVFVIVTAVVINNTIMPSSSRVWKDNVLIRMMIDARDARDGNR
jgi:hypothetical protein